MFLSFRLIRVFRGQNIVFIFSLSSFQTASQSYAFRREKPLAKRGGFTAEAVTLNFLFHG